MFLTLSGLPAIVILRLTCKRIWQNPHQPSALVSRSEMIPKPHDWALLRPFCINFLIVVRCVYVYGLLFSCLCLSSSNSHGNARYIHHCSLFRCKDIIHNRASIWDFYLSGELLWIEVTFKHHMQLLDRNLDLTFTRTQRYWRDTEFLGLDLSSSALRQRKAFRGLLNRPRFRLDTQVLTQCWPKLRSSRPCVDHYMMPHVGWDVLFRN